MILSRSPLGKENNCRWSIKDKFDVGKMMKTDDKSHRNNNTVNHKVNMPCKSLTKQGWILYNNKIKGSSAKLLSQLSVLVVAFSRQCPSFLAL